MGVRLYNPVTGTFTSVDPVPGGNANAYMYPSDPINQFDLDGKKKCSKWKKWACKRRDRVRCRLGPGGLVEEGDHMRPRLRKALWDLGWGGRGTGVMFALAGIGAVLGGCVGALFDDWLMGSGFGMLAAFAVFIGLVVWAHRGHMNPNRKH